MPCPTRIPGIEMLPHLAKEARVRLQNRPNMGVTTGDMASTERRVIEACYTTLATQRIVGGAWAEYYSVLATRMARLRESGKQELARPLAAAET